MGFIWSAPASPLKESLLNTEPSFILRTGDILLTYASEFEIALDSELWAHVGIVVYSNHKLQVFSNGEFVDVHDWIYRHEEVIVRHCEAIRPAGFDTAVLNACSRTADILLRGEIELHYREGYCIGTVLGILGLASLDELALGRLRPQHFSHKTPFRRLHLPGYSEHWSI